ncbi:MAG: hypothetical protein WCJ30_22295 [Deltaproteobacteria bacterium]
MKRNTAARGHLRVLDPTLTPPSPHAPLPRTLRRDLGKFVRECGREISESGMMADANRAHAVVTLDAAYRSPRDRSLSHVLVCTRCVVEETGKAIDRVCGSFEEHEDNAPMLRSLSALLVDLATLQAEGARLMYRLARLAELHEPTVTALSPARAS